MAVTIDAITLATYVNHGRSLQDPDVNTGALSDEIIRVAG